MKLTLPGCLLLLAVCTPVHAEAIDLQCEDLAKQMIERLGAAGLLASSTGEAADKRPLVIFKPKFLRALIKNLPSLKPSLSYELPLYAHRSIGDTCMHYSGI